MKKDNNKIIFLLLFSVIFGLFGGVVGFLLANSYLFGSSFGLPFFSEFSINQIGPTGTNLIIRNAKKVVVEQDVKVKDAINLAKNSIVGIYPRAKDLGTNLKLGQDYYYWLNQAPAQGLILTADGWIITAWQAKEKTLSKWTVVLVDKKVYDIDKIITDKDSGFSFIHIKANGLPVVQFSEQVDLAGSLAIILKDWHQAAVNYFSYVDKGGPIYSSDVLVRRLVFGLPVDNDYANGFVFDISGNLVGMAKDGKFSHVLALKPCLESILRNGKISRPKLGLKYLLLDELAANRELKQTKGALVVEVNKKAIPLPTVSKAKFDLEPGDVVVSLNGLEVSSQQDIADILTQYQQDKMITIEYLRGKEKKFLSLDFKKKE